MLPENRELGACARVTTYATRADVYKYGLARGTLGAPGRLLAAVTASSDLCELLDHGFSDDEEVVFRAAEGGTMPGGLTSGTTYYVKRISDSTFKVAATPGGSTINISSDGVSVIASSALPFNDVLEFYSRWVDAFMPAHIVPFASPYPVIVKALVAELAAKKLQQLSGQASTDVAAAEVAAKAQLERFAKGLPLRDAAATGSANKAINSAITSASPDARGWGSETLP